MYDKIFQKAGRNSFQLNSFLIVINKISLYLYSIMMKNTVRKLILSSVHPFLLISTI